MTQLMETTDLVSRPVHGMGPKRIPYWAVPLTCSLIVGILWFVVGPVSVLIGLIMMALIGAAITSYAWMVALVLVVRTCLDAYYDQTVYLGSVRVSAAAVFSLAMTGLITWSLVASRCAIPSSDGLKAFGLLILGSGVGVLTSYVHFGAEGNMALREITRLAMLLIWYVFLYSHSRMTGDSRPFIRGVFMASVLPLAVGVVNFLTGTGVETNEFIRISSTFVDPNAFGFYLLFLIMFCFAGISSAGSRVAWAVMWLSLAFMVFTYSRGAWIALMIAAPLYWLRVSRRWLRVGLVILAIIIVTYPILSARLASVDYGDVLDESKTGVTSNSFSFRVLIWRELLKQWTIHPLLGWGLEATPIINPIRLMPDNRGYAAHNDGVRYLVETGVLGFGCYIYFLVILGRNLLRRSRELAGRPLQPYAVAALATYVAVVIQGFSVSEPLHQSSFMFHFLGLAAVLDGCTEFRGVRAVSPVDGRSGVEEHAMIRRVEAL